MNTLVNKIALVTFRRKIPEASETVFRRSLQGGLRKRKVGRRAEQLRKFGEEEQEGWEGGQALALAAMCSLMWMMLSAITPRPTQRFIPAAPLNLDCRRPCRRLSTLMRPSQPVRHF